MVLEKNDESWLDGEDNQCKYSGDYWMKKRVVGYRKKETDGIFGTRDQSGCPKKSGVH